MTHKERVLIRRKIAEAISSGHSVCQACRKFKVSVGYVRSCCEEKGVLLPKKVVNVFTVFKMALSGIRQSKIAEALGASRQRICQIVRQARESGFDI